MKIASPIGYLFHPRRCLVTITVIGIVLALAGATAFAALTSHHDLRFSDPIVKLVPGERLLTISGTVYGIPADRLTARIGYRLTDGSVIMAMGSNLHTEPTDVPDATSRQLSFTHYRQFEIPDDVTVAEPVVLLFNESDEHLLLTTGQTIDVSGM